MHYWSQMKIWLFLSVLFFILRLEADSDVFLRFCILLLTINYSSPAASVCLNADLKGHWTLFGFSLFFHACGLRSPWWWKSPCSSVSPPLSIVNPFPFLSASLSFLHLSQVCLTSPPLADFPPLGALKEQPWRPAPYPATTCQRTSWWWWGMVASGRAPWPSSFSRRSLCRTTTPR